MRKTCRVCKNRLFKEPLITLRNVPCSAQNFPEKSELRKDRGITLKIYQCSGCGLVQLVCKPVPYYREVIRAVGISEVMMNFRKKYFEDFIKKYELKNKKIIEIGCGNGDYLAVLSGLSVNAYGLEYSDKAIQECRKKGLKVFKGFIEDASYKIENSPFDAFLCLSFFEHIPSPNAFLRGIWSNLKDKAVGIIEVPNFDNLLQKRLIADFIHDHLFYFNDKTLKFVAEANGFEVLDIKKIWNNYLYAIEVKKRTKIDLTTFFYKLDTIKKEISEFVSSFSKIAIWGASHQALTYISLLNLKSKVKYIVDSAFFKQNKFTPATHIPIFSPEKLKEYPVEAIIIMVGGYNDEVVAIVKKMGLNITIGVMNDSGLEIKKYV
jgi:SAM-dependent methyltransferase